MVKIKVLTLRNKYYKDNPMLKKESFTAEDEIAIDEFLSRIKHPLLLKHQKVFDPEQQQPLNVPFTIPPRLEEETTENYSSFANFYRHGSQYFFD